MTPIPPTDQIAADDQLLIDTSTLIAYLNGDEPASAASAFVLDELVARGRNPAVVSAITVAELLVHPLKAGPPAVAKVRTFLLGFPGVSIRSCDFLVAVEAARIRAVTGAEIADALIAASATLTSSTWLITCDRALRDRMKSFEWSTQVMLL